MTGTSPLITLFAAPKPFQGSAGAIQQRAIKSWLNLGPSCEVILLGDEVGIKETAMRNGTGYIQKYDRNEFGTPLVSSIFEAVEREAHGSLLCYINADIILMSDFLGAVQAIPFGRFLLTGRRRDLGPHCIPDLSSDNWEATLRERVVSTGLLQTPTSVDYFAFTRRLFDGMPPFALGRFYWDSWFPYAARVRGAELIDATHDVYAVHQNHGFEHYEGGRVALWNGPEARRNLALLGGRDHAVSVIDATWVLRDGQIVRPARSWRRLWREVQVFPILHPRARPLLWLFRSSGRIQPVLRVRQMIWRIRPKFRPLRVLWRRRRLMLSRTSPRSLRGRSRVDAKEADVDGPASRH